MNTPDLNPHNVTYPVIRETPNDIGSDLYLKVVRLRGKTYEVPDYKALEADGRIRDRFDPNDWTPGDYTFARDTLALYLTGTGAILWQCRAGLDA